MQPLHSTALGKVLSAYDPVAHSEVVDADREAFTPRTVTGLGDFEGLLDLTRARGWAADVEETWEGWPRWPRRSMTGGGCRWVRWGSPERWSGSARRASCDRKSSPP